MEAGEGRLFLGGAAPLSFRSKRRIGVIGRKQLWAAANNTSAAEGHAEVKTFAEFGVTRSGSRNTSISALGQEETRIVA